MKTFFKSLIVALVTVLPLASVAPAAHAVEFSQRTERPSDLNILYTRTNGYQVVKSSAMYEPWANEIHATLPANIKQKAYDTLHGDVVLLTDGTLWGNGTLATGISTKTYGAAVSHPTLTNYKKLAENVRQFHVASAEYGDMHGMLAVLKDDDTVWEEVQYQAKPASNKPWRQIGSNFAWIYYDNAYRLGTSISYYFLYGFNKSDGKIHTKSVWYTDTNLAAAFTPTLPATATAQGLTWENAVAKTYRDHLILKSGEVVKVATSGVSVLSDLPPAVKDFAYAGSGSTIDTIVLTTDGKILGKGANQNCMLGNGCGALANWTSIVDSGADKFALGNAGVFYVKSDNLVYYRGGLGTPSYWMPNPSGSTIGAPIMEGDYKLTGSTFETVREIPVHNLGDTFNNFAIDASDGTVSKDVYINIPRIPGAKTYELWAGYKSDGTDQVRLQSVNASVTPVKFALSKSMNNTGGGCGDWSVGAPFSSCTDAQSWGQTQAFGLNAGKKMYFTVKVKNPFMADKSSTDDGYVNAPTQTMTLNLTAAFNGTGSGKATFIDPNLQYGTDERFTLSVFQQPINGGTVVADLNGSFTYTAAKEFVGTDEFIVKAVDKSGAEFLKWGTVYVACPAATIKSIRFSPAPALQNGRVIVKYDAPSCANNLSIAMFLKNGTTDYGNLVSTDAGLNQLPTGVDREISINYSNLDPREYQVVVKMEDTEWKVPTERTFPFVIIDPLKTDFELIADKWDARAYVDLVTIKTKNNGAPICTLTTSEQAARNSVAAGSLKCLLEWVNVPSGLSQAQGVEEPKLSGYLTTEGPQRIDYKLSLFRDNGEKVTFKENFKTFSAERPANPVQVLSPTSGTPIYAVPSNGGPMAKVLVDSMGAGVITKFQIDDGPVQEFVTAKGTAERPIEAKVTDLWSRHKLFVRTQYSNKATIYTEETVEVLTAPSDKIKAELTAPEKTLDNAPTPMSVKIGIPSVAYEAPVHGEWRVHLAKLGSGGELTAITAAVPTVDGVANIVAPPFNSMEPKKIVAVAEVVSPLEGFTKRIVSDARMVFVEKGSALNGELSANRTTAPAPGTITLSTKMATKDDTLSLKFADFYISRDNGTTWTKSSTTEQSSLGRMTRRFTGGVYKVKAIFTNRHTGITSESNVVTINAFHLPQMTIAGERNAFPGTPIVLTTNFAPLPDLGPDAGVVDNAVVTEWEVEGMADKVAGPTLTLESMESKLVKISARARSAAADPSDPNVWVTEKLIAKFMTVGAPKIMVSGPQRAEVGKSSTYKAFVMAPWAPAKSVHEIKGEWTLPDGQTVPGFTLDWTPRVDDLSPVKQVLRFRAWVEGYQEQGAQQTADYRVTVWQYVWPNFTLKLSQDTTYAPSIAKIDVITDEPKLLAQFKEEKLSLAYTFPAGAEVMKHKGSQAQLRLPAEGSYPVLVTLADTRGNLTTLSHDLLAIKAEPFVISAKLSPSNTLWREPVSVIAKPSSDGGHPFDRATAYEFKVNGTPIDAKGGIGRFTLENAGNHELEIKLLSRFGAVQTTTIPITVIPNKPPVCQLVHKANTTSRSVTITGNCTDSDGKIIGYRWEVNGEKMGSTSNRIVVPLPDSGTSITATIEATDDSRATITASETFTF